MNKTLTIWTIFDKPSDYPEGFIARKWKIKPGEAPQPTNQIITSSNLETLQSHFSSMGLACLPKSSDDTPSTVESWI